MPYFKMLYEIYVKLLIDYNFIFFYQFIKKKFDYILSKTRFIKFS